jgi:hypothetical protein
MRVYVVRKWALPGRSLSVCWNITWVSLWLLCNVHFVQSICPAIATWPRWPKGTDHCNSEEYWCTHLDTCVARTWILYQCLPCHPWCTHRTSLVVKKTFQFSCGCEQFHYCRSFGFIVRNACNHGEHHETPRIKRYYCALVGCNKTIKVGRYDQPRGLVVRVSGYWSGGPWFDSRFCHGDFSLKGKIPMGTMVWVV